MGEEAVSASPYKDSGLGISISVSSAYCFFTTFISPLHSIQDTLCILCHCFEPLTIYRAPSHLFPHHSSSIYSSESSAIFLQSIHLSCTCSCTSFHLQPLPVGYLVDHTYHPVTLSSLHGNNALLRSTRLLLCLLCLLPLKLRRQAPKIRWYVCTLLPCSLPPAMRPISLSLCHPLDFD